jgi:chloramphenicol-sensitive protein RarD
MDPGSAARPPASDAARGIIFAIAAYGLWGFAPAYWKLLKAAPAFELLDHRVLWSLLVGVLLLFATRRWSEFAAVLRTRSKLLPIVFSSLLIGANWLIFIHAVNTGRVLATSLGYFLNPLVSVLLGVAFLGERLTRGQVAAVLIGAAGVGSWAWQLGEAPWIALSLAASFGIYGLVRKVVVVAPLVGFTLEVLLLAPFSLAHLARLASQGESTLLGSGAGTLALVAGSGLVTAAPLLCFISAAHLLPLSTLGFLQYLAPSITFLLAVGVYGEPFGRAQALAFSCVWIALMLFSFATPRTPRGTIDAARRRTR